jgi:hypothetical protein
MEIRRSGITKALAEDPIRRARAWFADHRAAYIVAARVGDNNAFDRERNQPMNATA